jgi:hypothetical protein
LKAKLNRCTASCPANRTLTEDFEPVTVDLEVGSTAEFVEQRLDTAILEFDDCATIRADEMVMMPVGCSAEEVRVATIWLMQSV